MANSANKPAVLQRHFHVVRAVVVNGCTWSIEAFGMAVHVKVASTWMWGSKVSQQNIQLFNKMISLISTHLSVVLMLWVMCMIIFPVCKKQWLCVNCKITFSVCGCIMLLQIQYIKGLCMHHFTVTLPSSCFSCSYNRPLVLKMSHLFFKWNTHTMFF